MTGYDFPHSPTSSCMPFLTRTLSQIMLLDQGRIAEFDKPATLLANPQSKFYALCKATGAQEFAVLRKMARL